MRCVRRLEPAGAGPRRIHAGVARCHREDGWFQRGATGTLLAPSRPCACLGEAVSSRIRAGGRKLCAPAGLLRGIAQPELARRAGHHRGFGPPEIDLWRDTGDRLGSARHFLRPVPSSRTGNGRLPAGCGRLADGLDRPALGGPGPAFHCGDGDSRLHVSRGFAGIGGVSWLPSHSVGGTVLRHDSREPGIPAGAEPLAHRGSLSTSLQKAKPRVNGSSPFAPRRLHFSQEEVYGLKTNLVLVPPRRITEIADLPPTVV